MLHAGAVRATLGAASTGSNHRALSYCGETQRITSSCTSSIYQHGLLWLTAAVALRAAALSQLLGDLPSSCVLQADLAIMAHATTRRSAVGAHRSCSLWLSLHELCRLSNLCSWRHSVCVTVPMNAKLSRHKKLPLPADCALLITRFVSGSDVATQVAEALFKKHPEPVKCSRMHWPSVQRRRFGVVTAAWIRHLHQITGFSQMACERRGTSASLAGAKRSLRSQKPNEAGAISRTRHLLAITVGHLMHQNWSIPLHPVCCRRQLEGAYARAVGMDTAAGMQHLPTEVRA